MSNPSFNIFLIPIFKIESHECAIKSDLFELT